MIAAVASALSIWGAITGFYGTKHWEAQKVCQTTYLGDRFAMVQLTIRGRPHTAALHLFSKRRGWVVMWSDGTVVPKIGRSTAPLVRAEVTRLKVRCLAP